MPENTTKKKLSVIPAWIVGGILGIIIVAGLISIILAGISAGVYMMINGFINTYIAPAELTFEHVAKLFWASFYHTLPYTLTFVGIIGLIAIPYGITKEILEYDKKHPENEIYQI
ncbi:MAG: hypothetical protein ACFFAS_12900 [Promethearchaeota archaeon]